MLILKKNLFKDIGNLGRENKGTKGTQAMIKYI